MPGNPAGGQRANLLSADGQTSTTISAYVETPEINCSSRHPVASQPVEATVTDPTTGALLGSSGMTDGNGWAQFTFQAPLLAPGTTVVAGGVTLTSRSLPVALHQAAVFSYAGYDFHNIAGTAADVTGPSLSVAQIQAIFGNYNGAPANAPSFLANLYFKGHDAFMDDALLCPSSSCDYVLSDRSYVTTDICPNCDLQRQISPVSAASLFYDAAQLNGLNAFALLALAQRENSLLGSVGLPSQAILNLAMGSFSGAKNLRDQIYGAAADLQTYLQEGSYGTPAGLVPPDGWFFFHAPVPIGDQPLNQVIIIRSVIVFTWAMRTPSRLVWSIGATTCTADTTTMCRQRLPPTAAAAIGCLTP